MTGCQEKHDGKVIIREASKKMYDAGKILVSRKLPVLEEDLAPHGFALPNKSFLVNLYHVDVVRKNEIELDNGEVIGISRLYKSHFSEMYAKFSGGKYDVTSPAETAAPHETAHPPHNR